MALSTGGRNGINEINVTPMVDVMLVLLIIFMVAAPLIQQGVEVNLPQAKAQALDVDDDRLILSIKADGSMFLGDSPLPRDQFREKLKTNRRLADTGEVYLQADRALPYGTVVDVMAALQEAGVTNLGMITDPSGASPTNKPRGKTTGNEIAP